MLTVFQVCFFVGIALIVLSFLFGSILDGFGLDGIDFDFFGIDVMLPLSPILLILFATVFGGTGFILMKQTNPLKVAVIIVISILLALAITLLVFFCVIRPLKKAQNTSAPTLEELIGLAAEVTENIRKDGYGEIKYVIHGNSFSSPAKGSQDEEIKAGSKVSICWIKDNVFYVTNINI